MPRRAASTTATGPTSIRLGLLGGFRLQVSGADVELPLNAQRLVCFLALQDRPILRSFLAGSLWGDVTQDHAGGSLRSALWRLGDPAYRLAKVTGNHVSLAPGIEIDLRDGELLARRILDPAQELNDVQPTAERALTSDLLPDWTEDWVLLERERYHQLRLRALEALCERLSVLGRHGEAVQTGIAAVAGEPLRESARAALIGAHMAAGNGAAATREYRAFARLLRAEMGLEPSDGLRGLIEPAGGSPVTR